MRGAEYRITRTMLDALPGRYAMVYICGMELQEPTAGDTLSWLEDCRETAVLYAPGPQGVLLDTARQDRVLALRPILHLNETEALTLSGKTSPEAAAVTLGGRTGNIVVITLGRAGCLCRKADGTLLRVPAPAVMVADTIGAGDTHAGVLLGCLHQGMALKRRWTGRTVPRRSWSPAKARMCRNRGNLSRRSGFQTGPQTQRQRITRAVLEPAPTDSQSLRRTPLWDCLTFSKNTAKPTPRPCA